MTIERPPEESTQLVRALQSELFDANHLLYVYPHLVSYIRTHPVIDPIDLCESIHLLPNTIFLDRETETIHPRSELPKELCQLAIPDDYDLIRISTILLRLSLISSNRAVQPAEWLVLRFQAKTLYLYIGTHIFQISKEDIKDD